MAKEIQTKWSDFTKENIKSETDNYGVYEISDIQRNILNIGEGHLKTRLLIKHPDNVKSKERIPEAAYYRCEYTGSKLRCEQRERALQKLYKSKHKKHPKYNKQLGDLD